MKPHGQLYNHAAIDPELAAAFVAQAVRDVKGRSSCWWALANSALVDEGRKLGLVVTAADSSPIATTPTGAWSAETVRRSSDGQAGHWA